MAATAIAAPAAAAMVVCVGEVGDLYAVAFWLFFDLYGVVRCR